MTKLYGFACSRIYTPDRNLSILANLQVSPKHADESDANQLEKLEKLLTNALRDTKSKKTSTEGRETGPPLRSAVLMLAKQNGEGSRSRANSSGSRGQEEVHEQEAQVSCA
ncbi:hypothetical protein OsI_04980 [Oryza sativa Indica Group]|uniref:Uncharacterized protein n=1 Tax=Oryza sativa subsp. indica TaxID=39946 RepID=B8A8F7_ORYSI|nr:hypothetical protein OsI_04980 [Oryza sativa Indica Group]